jgi:hypothetical protein
LATLKKPHTQAGLVRQERFGKVKALAGILAVSSGRDLRRRTGDLPPMAINFYSFNSYKSAFSSPPNRRISMLELFNSNILAECRGNVSFLGKQQSRLLCAVFSALMSQRLQANRHSPFFWIPTFVAVTRWVCPSGER